jgi:hypothetical protein
LHNFPTIPQATGSLKCLCPILPGVAVLFTKPMSYVNSPTVLTVRLGEDEVDLCNEIIQIYSKNYVLYRSGRPRLVDHFLRTEHLEYQYHSLPWLDWVMHNVANYRPGGQTLTEEPNPLIALGYE